MKSFHETWIYLAAWTIGLAMFVSGCVYTEANYSGEASGPADLFISVTNDMESNPQAVDMALKFAGFSLDEGRDVFLFFNVKGVRVPIRDLPDDAQFQTNGSIKQQLQDLTKRGAVIHVCPVCMKALAVEATDLMEGAKVTNRGDLFARIHGNVAVFTY